LFGFFQGWRFYRQPASWRPAVPGAARHQKRTKFREGPDSELPPGSSIPVPPGSGPIPEQSFGMFARQPGQFLVFVCTQRGSSAGWRKPASSHVPAGENPNKVSAGSVSQPDSASEGGRLHRATVFFPVILVDYAI